MSVPVRLVRFDSQARFAFASFCILSNNVLVDMNDSFHFFTSADNITQLLLHVKHFIFYTNNKREAAAIIADAPTIVEITSTV